MPLPHPHVYDCQTTSCFCDTCVDILPDCREYTRTACEAPYRLWAYQNCAAYCGFCRKPCEDVISDCDEYGSSACKAPYVSWAISNCAKYCGFCEQNKQKAQCSYSDWMTVSDCSVTCGSGYKTEVRSFLKVKEKTPGSKDCKEELERYTKCELDPCPE
ncbi:spondin-1-like [Saccostrea echinata]|uniref:spondin-1-like n=1 Tax=Saccostrea echinata TaxID=191078 RepID=UPI002A805310|nr:spondin-1-like [Saccostrea echinata]